MGKTFNGLNVHRRFTKVIQTNQDYSTHKVIPVITSIIYKPFLEGSDATV